MRKHLGWAIRMLIAAAGVAYILYTLNWTSQVVLPDGTALGVAGVDEQWVTLEPGQATGDLGGLELSEDGRVARASLASVDAQSATFEPSIGVVIHESDKPLLLAGLAVFAPVFLIGSLRWMVLMRARGIEIGYLRACRLTMAGQFFNLCMPGTTGGDVMKAYYATRATHQRADAVISVAVDRACGLIGLTLLVGIIGLLSLDEPVIRRLTITMWGGLAVFIALACLYASRAVRQRLGTGRLLDKLPGARLLRRFDGLVAAYRDHKAALVTGVLLTLPIQLAFACSMALAGYAIGVEQGLLYLLGTIPIVLLLWALPISGPLGLGPLDYVAMHLIVGSSPTTAQQAVVMFVGFRLYTVTLGLCGSLTLFGADAPTTKTTDAEA